MPAGSDGQPPEERLARRQCEDTRQAAVPAQLYRGARLRHAGQLEPEAPTVHRGVDRQPVCRSAQRPAVGGVDGHGSVGLDGQPLGEPGVGRLQVGEEGGQPGDRPPLQRALAETTEIERPQRPAAQVLAQAVVFEGVRKHLERLGEDGSEGHVGRGRERPAGPG